jgi:hypothetical protein
MSLSAKLLDGEYWECFADEFGFARFQRVLDGSSPSSDIFSLAHVQYCLPSVQVNSIVDMVVVRAADPPPFRQCGDWMQIIDRGTSSMVRIADLAGPLMNHLVPNFGAHNMTVQTSMGAMPVMGTKFTWGQVSSEGQNPGDDPTCSHGIFSQNGGIIYPDYERKQGYKDGINDMFELGPHMSILFWMTDVDFGSDDDSFLRHYNIQFVKSSEFPVLLRPGGGAGLENYFGPSCHTGPGSTPSLLLDMGSVNSSSSSDSCVSVSKASDEAKKKPSIQWSEHTIPSFFAYKRFESQINFGDISKWDLGSNQCYDNQIDSMYESTSAMLGNGATLMGFEKFKARNITIGPLTPIFIGIQKESQTFDIPKSNYVEIPSESSVTDGILSYAVRAQAPHCGTYCTMPFDFPGVVGGRVFGWGPDSTSCVGDSVEWINHWWHLMLTEVHHSWAHGLGGMSGYGNYAWIVKALQLKRPGYLMGISGDGMFTIDTWWAKINISRPGLIVQGKGKDVESFLSNVKVRVMPVYLVDMPAPVAACGNTGFDKVLDPDTDVWDNMYCTVEDKVGDTEKLQEASTGINLDISLPFLFPGFSAGTGGGNAADPANLRNSFDKIGEECYKVAQNLFGYFDSFRDEPNKSMTYICSPPRSQEEVPSLGKTVVTPYGPRTINSISFQYTDSSVFNMTVDVGPITINQASAGGLKSKRIKTEDVDGRVVSHEYGSLFKVRIQGIGVVNAWNSQPWPWEVGDKVKVQLYNNPMEL